MNAYIISLQSLDLYYRYNNGLWKQEGKERETELSTTELQNFGMCVVKNSTFWCQENEDFAEAAKVANPISLDLLVVPTSGNIVQRLQTSAKTNAPEKRVLQATWIYKLGYQDLGNFDCQLGRELVPSTPTSKLNHELLGDWYVVYCWRRERTYNPAPANLSSFWIQSCENGVLVYHVCIWSFALSSETISLKGLLYTSVYMW
jgi:hypothetical protein